MTDLTTTLTQLERWSDTLAFCCDDNGAPLVEGIVKRLHDDAVGLGATAQQLAAAELVKKVAA